MSLHQWAPAGDDSNNVPEPCAAETDTVWCHAFNTEDHRPPSGAGPVIYHASVFDGLWQLDRPYSRPDLGCSILPRHSMRESLHFFRAGTYCAVAQRETMDNSGNVESSARDLETTPTADRNCVRQDENSSSYWPLWMGDIGWEEPTTVVDGRVPKLVLGEAERLWLQAYWNAATAGRQK